jgi:hypothetical protein
MNEELENEMYEMMRTEEQKKEQGMSVFDSQDWCVKVLTADNTPQVCDAAVALAKELLEMDAEGAIELDTWPKARKLIMAVLS